MSLFPITTARGLIGQPVMTYSWELVFPDLPAVVNPYAQAMSVKARSVMIPGQQNQAYDTHWGPFIFTHPGKKTYPRGLNIDFEETYKNPVMAALKLWNQLVFNEETGKGEPEADLKANLWIRFLGPNPEGVQAIAEAIHVYEVFPKSVVDVPVDYRGEGQLFITATMGYNIWRWETWPF